MNNINFLIEDIVSSFQNPRVHFVDQVLRNDFECKSNFVKTENGSTNNI